jgi:STE24 endopeptidase
MHIQAVFLFFQAFIIPTFKGIAEHHKICEYNAPFILILSIIIFNFILERTLDLLNSKTWRHKLPAELNDVYDDEQYEKAQQYKLVNNRFGLLTNTFSFILIITVLVFHVFGYLDQVARSITENPILVALVFFGIIMIFSDIINTPF